MFNKYSTAVENNLTRNSLNKAKISSQKNSLSNLIVNVCDKYKHNMNNRHEVKMIIDEVSIIINDKNTIISKRARSVWNYELYRIRWTSKEQILTTLYNIMLKADGLGINN